MGQAPSSDAMLEASLDNLKRTNSAYLKNQNPQTTSEYMTAMDRHGKALADGGMSKQAGDMEKAKMDFQNSSPGKRQRIAGFLGKTLMNMTVKKLSEWCFDAMVDEILPTTDTKGGGLSDTHEIEENDEEVVNGIEGPNDTPAIDDAIDDADPEAEGTCDPEGGCGISDTLSSFLEFFLGSESEEY